MHRRTQYAGARSAAEDLLLAGRFAMVSMAYLAQDIIGSATQVLGASCGPTTPTASLAVSISPGRIYEMAPLEATAWSSLAPDTTDTIFKQGLLFQAQTISLPNITTTGKSVVYLIQGQYQDFDTDNQVLSYYDASNPTVPFAGPGNSGTAQPTTRQGLFVVQALAGTIATTGTQTTPAATAGWTPLYAVTIAFGATTVTSGNITQFSAAFFNRTNQCPQEILAGVSVVNGYYEPGNVKRYGVIGDGITVNTTTIQNALNVAITGGLGKMYFPGGQYLCGALSGTILNAAGETNTNKALRIYGDGPNTSQLIQSGSITGLLTLKSSNITTTLTESLLVIENMSFQGTGSAGNICNGIYLRGLAVWKIRNVYSCGFFCGVNLDNSLIGSISDESLLSDNQIGIQMNGSTPSPANLVTVSDSRILANTTYGANLISGSGIRFNSVDFEFNGVSIAQAATFTNSSPNIGVTTSSSFAVGQTVVFSATANGFTANTPYFVLTNSGNITVSATAGGSAINATGTTPMTVTGPNVATGAVNVSSSLNAGFGGAILSFANCWWEANNGQCFTAVLGAGVQLSFRESLMLGNVAGADLAISGSGGSVSIDNSYFSTAIGSVSTIGSGVEFSTIKNSVMGTVLNDSAVIPTYINSLINGAVATNGRITTFTLTLTGGVTGSGPCTAYQQGGEVTLTWQQISGTGSGSTVGVSGIPTSLQTASSFGGAVGIVDNGTNSLAYALVSGSTGAMVISHTFAGSGVTGLAPSSLKYRKSN